MQQGVQADEILAKEHKLAGNALFRQAKYLEAALLYTGKGWVVSCCDGTLALQIT